jgi:DNA repair photolyase
VRISLRPPRRTVKTIHDDALSGIRQREITCRTILSPSGIPGADYSINPYIGCAHACAYCYAHYMQRYSGHDEPWGSFVDLKVNAPQVLIRQLRRIPRASLFMSSVTDPYQPPEQRSRITRRILEILAPLSHSLSIHTKSSLVERDICILREFRDVSVTFTIVTGDEDAVRCIEPRAPTVAERIRALEQLSHAGIATSVFIGPIIPFVTERNIERLLARISGAGVGRLMLDDLHYFSRIRKRLLPALYAYDGDVARRAARIPENYYQHVAHIILKFCLTHGMQCVTLF